MLRNLEQMARLINRVDRAMCRIATANEIMSLLSYKPHLVVQDVYICLESCKMSDARFQLSLCYSVIALNWSVLNQGCLTPMYSGLIESLLDSLEHLQPSSDEEECYAWMLTVAIGHSYNDPALASGGRQLLESILNKYTFTKDWKQLQKVLEKFF